MKIVFCCDPRSQENPDSMYIDEVAAATRAGLPFVLIDYEALMEANNAARAVRHIPVHQPAESAVYRGWPLQVNQYAALYDALLSRGIRLINSMSQFKHTQHLPQSLHIIQQQTPETVWMETDGNVAYDAVMQLLLPFAGQPIILRDYALAEKHYWHQACYISSSSDPAIVRSTIEYFLRLRGKQFEGGLVFRQFIDFEALSDTATSGMPLVKEYRIFYLDAQPITTVWYWHIEGYDHSQQPDPDQFKAIAQHVRSRFFTMDVAQRPDGTWLIIDLGDAQIATLPPTSNLDIVYRALAQAPEPPITGG